MEKKIKKLSKDKIIENLNLEIKELKDDLLRARADFENFRKRNENEKELIKDKTIINVISEIIPCVENLESALQVTENNKIFIQGVEMILQNLLKVLEENKVKSFKPKEGDDFNPIQHEPLLVEDNENKHKEGKVLKIVKKGYLHKNKVIMPAKVQVKKINN